jgi:hypothetical protein
MNALTKHPQEQGVTYWQHLDFAIGIACRLCSSMIIFALHALLPFIPIKPRFDLQATAAFLNERNRWIEAAKYRKQNDGKKTFKNLHLCRYRAGNTDSWPLMQFPSAAFTEGRIVSPSIEQLRCATYVPDLAT